MATILRLVSRILEYLATRAAPEAPRTLGPRLPPRPNPWRRLLARAVFRHRWAMQGQALRFSRNMPRHLDLHPARGLTIQGSRWGWREVRTTW